MFKKNKEQKNTNEIGFEERERKTPFLGYLLLVAMAIVVLLFGFAVLDDLGNVPQKPEKLSSCSFGYITYGWGDSFRDIAPNRNYYKRDFSLTQIGGDCVFSNIEKKYGIDKIFLEGKLDRKEIADLRNNISEKEFELQRLKQNYQLGLLEKIADVPKGYETENRSAQIQKLENELASLRASLAQKEKKLEPQEKQLQEKYGLLQKEYRSLWRIHDFYVFLLQIILIFPLFFILLKAYFKLSAKNSPYLIIVTFLFVPISIFVVQIVFVYFWGLFLAVILEVIWNFIKEIQILKSLLLYLGMILSALLFGGAVYFLQKKIFNPKRVALRQLRDKKCPNCSFSLRLSKNFCSQCGIKILEKCQKCGQDRYVDLPFCQYCKDKIER